MAVHGGLPPGVGPIAPVRWDPVQGSALAFLASVHGSALAFPADAQDPCRREVFPAAPRRPITPSMRADFVKMHGCGNDFVVLDARAMPAPPARALPLGLDPARIAALADRRRGIGCDQLVLLQAPGAGGGDVLARFFNPDGAEAGACGNGTRCVVALLGGREGRARVAVRTRAGLLPGERLADGRVRVDMGRPGLGWADVPLARAMDTLRLELPHCPPGLEAPAAASMGNPHVTFFVPQLDGLDVARLGAALEQDALFPERANVGFAQVLAQDRIRLRVWERGAGLTLACGSGACATLVNAARRGLTGRRAEVLVDGGALEVSWEPDGRVLMTGPVATAYTGVVEL